ncbi:MAG TPA: SPW repeat protein [Methylomirabilota bacterium]|jgi:hypothetical protein|nr:SPW repeat protein [Methylomirabilota bacterium]
MTPLYGFLISLILGLWLLISPYALGFTEMAGAYWNAVVVGLISAVNAALGLYYNRGEMKGHSMMPHAQKA